MKKRSRILLLGAACLFLLAACGSEAMEETEVKEEYSAETLVQNADTMLEEADSFAAEFSMTVAMGDAAASLTEGTVELIRDPLYVKVDSVMDFADQEQVYGLYLEKAGDEVNQYMSYNGEWTEMTMEEESALTGVQIYNTASNMKMIFSAAENWTVEENGAVLQLTGEIPEEKFYAVECHTRWFQMAGMSGLSEVYFEGMADVPVSVTLDAKTGAPVSYAVELAAALETVTNNVLKELNGGISGNSIAVTEYQITSSLTQIGDVKAAEIPAEAKNDAINYEKEISLLEEGE